MKILLLGGSGQLGMEWRSYLQQISGVRYLAPDSSEVDITDKKQLQETFQTYNPHLVINCAAYTQVDQAEDESAKARDINARAAGILADICRKWSAKLIHYSTDYVFPGQKEDKQEFPNGYTEDHPTDPINMYGQTKWEGEEAVRSSGCKHLIIRVSWLCGEYGGNFVKTMLRLGGEKSSLDIVADQWGSPTFTENTVRNTYILIEEEAEGTYHLTSNGLITWADFAEEIFRLSGNKVEVNRITSDEFPTKARRPYFSKLNTVKVHQIPGIELEDWKVGLKRLIVKLQ